MQIMNLPYDGVARSNMTVRMTNTWSNQVSGGAASLASYPRPATTADYMTFDGNQCIRFSDRSDWHVVSPYSVEFDFYCANTADGKWIATSGEGFALGWGEWSVIQSGGNILLVSSADNNGNQFSITVVPNFSIKQWYRVGFMFYTVGSQYRCRAYLNDVQVADVACIQPYDSTNGLVFGADWAWTTSNGGSARKWAGRLRNVTMAKSLFWTV